MAPTLRLLRRPQPPGLSALLPLRAPGAKPETRAERSAEPSGAHRAVAQAAPIPGTPDRWQPRSQAPPIAGSPERSQPRSRPPMDAQTMASQGPGPRAPLWTAALLLLGLPNLSVRADGECPRGGGVRGGAWGLGKRSSPGCPSGGAPENLKSGRERSERRPATLHPLPGHRVSARPDASLEPPNPSIAHGRKPGHWSCSPATSFPTTCLKGL